LEVIGFHSLAFAAVERIHEKGKSLSALELGALLHLITI